MKSYRRLWCGCLGLMQFESFGRTHEVCQGPHAHLPHDMTPMDLDGYFTEPKFSRHLFVHQTCGDERHDLPFAGRERLEHAPEFGKRLFAVTPFAVPFDGLRNGVEHVLLAKRLRQEIDRPCFHSPDGHRDVSMARYHDNGNVNVRSGQLSLEVEAAYSGQPDVEHDTARRLRELVLQEFRRRGEQS